MSRMKLAHFSPGLVILITVSLTILAGALCLALPQARTTEIAFLDLLFTATSATCVSGLFTIPLDQFTTFGHAIILLLIHIGGLGLITLTMILISLFVDLGYATQLMAGKLLELESWKNIRRFMLLIIAITLCFELLGALLFFPLLYAQFPFLKACFFACFHAIASFCNAGIMLPEYAATSFIVSPFVLIITAILMLAGGIGFVTWHEIVAHGFALRRKKRHAFSLNSKIILFGTLATVITATLLFLILEHNNTLASTTPGRALLNAVFHAISLRSSGLLITDIHSMHPASMLLIMIIAFIGSAPSSTGSGVKITSCAILFATIKTAILGRAAVDIRGRSVAKDQVHKAVAIIAMSFFWVLFTTFCLLITEHHHSFLDLLFETVSAFSTLGLSRSITPSLSLMGKVLILITMVVGRIGSLTLVLALKGLRVLRPEEATFTYPEERVMLS